MMCAQQIPVVLLLEDFWALLNVLTNFYVMYMCSGNKSHMYIYL